MVILALDNEYVIARDVVERSCELVKIEEEEGILLAETKCRLLMQCKSINLKRGARNKISKSENFVH